MKLEEYKRLLSLLAPHRAYDWIERPLNSVSWKSRCRGALEVGVLTKGHPVGIRPHKTKCCWAAIDIDFEGSPYHPTRDQEAIDKIRDLLRDQDLQAVILVQSSASKGIHIWIPLPEIETNAFARWFYRLFTSNNYDVGAGILELFSNVPSKGKLRHALRLPLIANDSWILDENLYPCHQSMNSFCDAWENCLKVNADFKLQSYDIKPSVLAPGSQGVRNAEERLRKGFTGHRQTYKLASDACFIGASQGISGRALQRNTCSLLKAAPGCQVWSKHWNEIRRGTYDAWWRHYSKYAGRVRSKNVEKQIAKKVKDPKYNQKLSAKRREVLANAITDIEKQGRFFPNRSAATRAINDFLKQSEGKGMSNSTIGKHADLVDRLVAKPD